MNVARKAWVAFGAWCDEVAALLDERAPDVSLGELAGWYGAGASPADAATLAINAQRGAEQP